MTETMKDHLCGICQAYLKVNSNKLTLTQKSRIIHASACINEDTLNIFEACDFVDQLEKLGTIGLTPLWRESRYSRDPKFLRLFLTI